MTLAQKFIDGPAREKRAAKRRRAQQTRRKTPAVKSAPTSPAQNTRKPEREMIISKPRPAIVQSPWDTKLEALTAKLRRARAGHKPSGDFAFALEPDRAAAPSVRPIRPRQTNRHADGRRKSKPVLSQARPPETRIVTILMIMHARKSAFIGVQKSINPTLCVGENCYISDGTRHSALDLPRARALAPVRSMGDRAGACRRSELCAFRQVKLVVASSIIEPVDLGWFRHDRRQPTLAAADPTCKLIRKHLTCDNAVEADGYRLWIVPEDVASKAGAPALGAALEDGLKPLRRHAAGNARTSTVK